MKIHPLDLRRSWRFDDGEASALCHCEDAERLWARNGTGGRPTLPARAPPRLFRWLLLLLSAGFALGSWIVMAPILLMAPPMVRRTLIGERMLARALPGYADYMRQVRSRIDPGDC